MSSGTLKEWDALSALVAIAGLADGLPKGAEVTIEWDDAPPDLVLLIALQDDAELHSSESAGNHTDEAEWKLGGVVFRARRSRPVAPRPPVKLQLVQP